jgi:hypothetical protein
VAIGVAYLVAEDRFDVGLYDLDRDTGGLIVAAYGFVLWRVAERARRFLPAARPVLLALTALLAPTLLGLPLTLWAWWLLAGADLRAYYDARARGLDAVEAAAVAQGLPLPPRSHPERDARRRAAARANRRAALVTGGLALAAYVAWMFVYADSPHRALRDHGFALLMAASGAAVLALGFGLLGRRVERRSWLRLNAWAWTLFSPVAPRVAARARMLARDARDERKVL